MYQWLVLRVEVQERRRGTDVPQREPEEDKQWLVHTVNTDGVLSGDPIVVLQDVRKPQDDVVQLLVGVGFCGELVVINFKAF